ncbi:hypothetical protein BGZ79_006897 [Entomortierella chlamydospora]|nr:hypothetical protein BGZ79_006897 [Entomortierella chlamydospora]
MSHLNMLVIDYNFDSWTAKYILSRCSSKLKKLTFRGVVTNVEDEGPEEDEEEEEREPIIRLKHKELILSRYREWDDSTEFWRWLWKRCGRVEILRVYDTGEAVESLADGILNNMPNLREIHLGRSDQYHMDLTDGDIATLLSSCLYGWRVVEIKHTANFREASKAALFKLFPTLEVLILGNDDLKNEDLVLLLSSAPKLQELVTLDDGYYRHRNPTSIRADLLIDLDPDKTNTLRTWPCEESLKVLKVVISGIGRADLEKQRRYEITKEVYPGEGRETQNRVYERLVRFTKLEKLWLGHHSSPPTCLEFHDYAPHYQLDCLDMCLESGLQKLEGLKDLRELSLAHMNTRIGLKEIQWMAAHWPKLRRIRGICGEEHECDIDKDKSKEYQEILGWLNEHCPMIKVSSSWDDWDEWEDDNYF